MILTGCLNVIDNWQQKMNSLSIEEYNIQKIKKILSSKRNDLNNFSARWLLRRQKNAKNYGNN